MEEAGKYLSRSLPPMLMFAGGPRSPNESYIELFACRQRWGFNHSQMMLKLTSGKRSAAEE